MLCCGIAAGAQTLKVNDLIALLARKNVDGVNQMLTQKGWEYRSSEGSDGHESTIVWSYGHNRYDDKAKAWMRVNFYDGVAARVSYQFFNDNSYNTLERSLVPAGFKSTGDSDVDDEYTSVYYSSAKHLLEFEYGYNEEDYYNVRYRVTLYAKGGPYDTQNGKKSEDLEEGGRVEYTLKDGVPNGPVKMYDEDGSLIGELNMVMGVKQGAFKSYHPNGKVRVQGNMRNDEYHGECKSYYEDGTQESQVTFQDGIKNGAFKTFYPDGKLHLEGFYKNDEYDGVVKEHSDHDASYSEVKYKEGVAEYQREYGSNGLMTMENILTEGKQMLTENTYNGQTLTRQEKTDMTSENISFTVQEFNEGKAFTTTLLRLNGRNLLVNHGGLQLKDMDQWEESDNGAYLPQSILEENPEDLYLMTLRKTDMNALGDPAQYRLKGCAFGANDIPLGSVCYFDLSAGSMNGHFSVFIDPKLYRQIYVERSVQDREKMMPATLDTNELKPYRIGGYSNNMKSGLWTTYHPQTGMVVSVGRYNQNRKEGLWRIYAPDGTLLQETTYLNGKLEGPSKTYGSYDESTGKIDAYYIEANYHENILHGAFKKEVKGTTTERFFQNGKLNGKETITTAEGRMVTTYRNDVKEGKMEHYNREGELDYSTTYRDDKLVGPTDLYKKGTRCFTILTDPKTGEPEKLEDCRKSGVTVTYEVVNESKLLLTRTSNDTTWMVNYHIGGELPFGMTFSEKDMAEGLEQFWNSGKNYMHGKFVVKSARQRTEYVSGSMDHGHKNGKWQIRFEPQQVVIEVDYDAIPMAETYWTLEGLPFGGEFEIVDEAHKIKEIRKVKEGVLNKTKYVDLNTGKGLKLKGSTIDYFPVTGLKLY